MSQVQTVMGPVDLFALGPTLMHEHMINRTPGLHEDYPGTYPRAEVLAICVEKMGRLFDAGIRTFVDHSPYDLGRDVALMAEVSERTGMQIVACTGVWIQPARFFQRRAPEEIAELLLTDLTEGIGGTGIRAGVIKCGTDTPGMTPVHERVMRACAIAHRATGAPISTHTDVGVRGGEDQQRVLADAGVPLERVLIGHSGDSDDLEYLHGLLARGSFLGMDRFGAEDLLPDARRVATVARLCAEGFAGRLALSHDANCWNDRSPERELLRARPAHHFHHLLDDVVPALLDSGVTQRQIDTMLVANPRAIFAGQSPERDRHG